MSTRENIANELVTTLQGITSPIAVSYVTREPFDFQKLSNAQFPAILVETAGETRGDATIGDTDIQRQSTIEYRLIGFVKGAQIDNARNLLIEGIEEKLDQDRSRGGYAVDTEVTTIETDEGSIDPIGGVIVTVTVLYEFTRGTT